MLSALPIYTESFCPKSFLREWKFTGIFYVRFHAYFINYPILRQVFTLYMLSFFNKASLTITCQIYRYFALTKMVRFLDVIYRVSSSKGFRSLRSPMHQFLLQILS